MAGFDNQSVQIRLTVDSKQVQEENKRIAKSIEDIQNGFKDLKPNTKAFEQQLKRLTAESEKFAKTLSLSELRKEYNRLKRAADNAKPNTEEYRKLQAQLQGVASEFRKVRAAQRNMGNEGSKLSSRSGGLGKLGGSLVAIASKVAAVATAVVAFVQGARQIDVVVRQYQKLRGEVQRLTGATDEQLTVATAGIEAIANTFNQDFNDVLLSANALSKQLGIEVTDALDLIEKGFLAGADANGDFLDQLKEYPAQFKQAGLSADEAIAIITQSATGGIFSDKGIDAVKEFGLRIREQTTATKDALIGAFGSEFTSEIFQGLDDGSISTIDALKRISGELGKLPESAKETQTVIADVFGGPGEDAGLEFLTNLQNIDGELNNLIDTTNSYTQQQQTQLQLEKRLSEEVQEFTKRLEGASNFFSNVWQRIKIATISGLNDIINFFIELPAQIQIFAVRGLENFNKFANGINKSLVGLRNRVAGVFGIDAVEAQDIELFSFDTSSAELQRQLELSRQKDFEKKKTEVAADGINKRQLQQVRADNTQKAKAEKQAKELQKIEDKAADERRKAAELTEQLRIEALEDGFEKERQKLVQQAKQRIDALTGDAEQVRENTALLKQILTDELAELAEGAFASDLAVLQEATQKRIAALVGTPEQIQAQTAVIQTELAQAIQDLLAQYGISADAAKEKVQEFFDTLSGDGQDIVFEAIDIDFDVKSLDLKQQLAQGLISVAEFEARTVALREAALQQKLALLQAAGETETGEYRDLTDELLDLQIERNEARLEKETEFQDQQKELQQQYRDAAFESAEAITGAIFAIEKNNIEKNLKAQLAALDKEKKAELEAAGDSETKKAAIEEKFAKKQEKLERDAAKKRKNLARNEAVINAALAATKTIANLGFPAALPALLALAVKTAAEIAVIDSQEFAQGGQLQVNDGNYAILSRKTARRNPKAVKRLVRRSGGKVLSGPSHAGGGVKLLSRTGAVLGEAEGGEPMIPLDSLSALDRAQANALLYASMFNGGRMQDGGFISPALPNATVRVTNVNSNEGLRLELQALRQDLQNFNTNLRAYITIEDLEDGIEEIELFGLRSEV